MEVKALDYRFKSYLTGLAQHKVTLVQWFDNGAQQAGTAIVLSAFIHKGKALLTATTDCSVHLWDA